MNVSIVIPLYNAEDTIKNTIESLLNQTYKFNQLIIVDDNSTDRSLEIVEALSDHRFVIIKNVTNMGGSTCRNIGFSHSDGEFLFFLDADDYFYPNFIESQVKKLISDSCLAVYCHAEDEDGNELGSNHSGHFANELILSQASIVSTSALAIKRELFVSLNGFDYLFMRHQDLEFAVRLMKHTELILNDNVLFKKVYSGSPSYDSVRNGIAKFVFKFHKEILNLGLFSVLNFISQKNLRLAELSYKELKYLKFTLHLIFSLINPLNLVSKLDYYRRKDFK